MIGKKMFFEKIVFLQSIFLIKYGALCIPLWHMYSVHKSGSICSLSPTLSCAVLSSALHTYST